MIELGLADMTCGHCAGIVALTVACVDTGAKVGLELQNKAIKISSNENRKNFAEALTDAGYAAAS